MQSANTAFILISIATLFTDSFSYRIVHSSQERTWAEAQTYCEDTYATNLATVQTQADLTTLLQQRDTAGVSAENMWIGLGDKANEGTFTWVSGEPCAIATNLCVDYWKTGEPNDLNNEDCVDIAYDPYNYAVDGDCATYTRRQFACDEQKYHTVYDTGTLRTWPQAQAYCQSTYDTNLATVQTSADLALLIKIRNMDGDSAKNSWIGLNDRDAEGQMTWVSGAACAIATNLCIDYWKDGEPNDWNNEDCVDIAVDGYDYAGDGPCEGYTRVQFFCDVTNPPTSNPTSSPSKNPTSFPSRQTSNPTSSPSKNPTSFPSRQPSSLPTSSPSKYPTSSPNTQPTSSPSRQPSSAPTKQPSIPPTKNPTGNPTQQPSEGPTVTNDPTQTPSGGPSEMPTKQPTQRPNPRPTEMNGEVNNEPSVSPTISATSDSFGQEAGTVDDGNIYLENASFIAAALLCIIIVISYIYSRVIRPNDFYKFVSLVIVSFHVLDVLSDVLFAISVSKEDERIIIFVSAIIFIVVPIIISLYQLNVVIKTWVNLGQEIKGWIRDYVALLYTFSLFTGSSFTAVDLCYSNLFNLPVFDIPLSKTEVNLFKTQRIYSIVLFENVPQIALQAWYIATSKGYISDIVYISLAFSAISIFITVISLTTQKTVISMTDYVEVQFEVNGADIGSKLTQCSNIVHQPRREIATILGVNKSVTDIYRPYCVPNGLCVKLNVYVSISKAIDMTAAKLLEDAKNNGSLAQIFEKCWKLNGTPTIQKINVRQINSKKRTLNTINIGGIDSMNRNESDGMMPKGEIETGIVPMVEYQIQMSSSPRSLVDGPAANTEETNMDILPPAPTVNIAKGNIGHVQKANKVKSYDSDESSSSSSQHHQNTPGNTKMGGDHDDDIVMQINQTKRPEGV